MTDANKPTAANIEVSRLKRRAERERIARKTAEQLLEAKSLELYRSNETLKKLAENLESQVELRTQELKAALERAKSADRAKSEFLGVMSHEIRTPLNGILGMAQLLESGRLTKEQREYVSTLKASGDVLVALVDDILDFARMEADALTMASSAFDPLSVAHKVIARFRPEATRRGLAIACDASDDVPTHILGDSARLEQVLGKLISNAVKFTISGAITLTLSVEADEHGARALLLAIRDTGIGIPEDRHADLFQGFSQLDSSTTRAYGGAGLGLAISARLVKAMGGSIGVESRSGVGSRFWISLPIHTPEARADASDQTTQAAASAAAENRSGILPAAAGAHSTSIGTKRILLMESNAISMLLTSRLLRRAGHALDTATNSAETIERAQQAAYDVILINVSSPVNDDEIQTIRTIRSLPLEVQPRIITLSASASTEVEVCVTAAGADSLVAIPMQVNRLYGLIAE